VVGGGFYNAVRGQNSKEEEKEKANDCFNGFKSRVIQTKKGM